MVRDQKALKIDNIDEELERVLFELQKVLATKKAPFTPFTDGSRELFISKPYQMKASVLHGTQAYLEILKTFQMVNKNPEDFETIQEDKDLLQIALNKFNYRPPKGEDFSFLKQGWVVEIYNLDMIQIYRNFEFFRQCSYDLYTILVTEWHVLYERNSKLTEKIFKQVEKVISSAKTTIPYSDIPRHTLKERYLNHNRVFSNELTYMTPLFDKETGVKMAFVNFVDSTSIGEMSLTHL